MRMLSPSQNVRNPFVPELCRALVPLCSPRSGSLLYPVYLPGRPHSCRRPATAFCEQTRCAGQGRKEAGPGYPRDKLPCPGTQGPAIGLYPVPAQPLSGLLLQSRVHAGATDSRSWYRCRHCLRHPAAATTEWRRLGHPSGRAGEGGERAGTAA